MNLCSLIACGVYYYAWLYLVPKLRGYRIRQEVLRLDNGAMSHRLVKVPVSELEAWDATHDAIGAPISTSQQGEKAGWSPEEEDQIVFGDKEKSAV